MNGIAKLPKGTGYYVLNDRYLWGSYFRRFPSPVESEIIEIIDTYKTGEPRNVVISVNGQKCGITLSGLILEHWRKSIVK